MTVAAIDRDATTTAGGAEPVHVVARGDTLSGIAQAHGVSLDALLKANPQILHPDLIRPGQVVRLPEAAGGTGREEPQTYTVKAGDTLSQIGERLGVSWRVLAQANGVSDPRALQIGTELRVGGASSAPTAQPKGQARPDAPAPKPAATPAPAAQTGTGSGVPGVSAKGFDFIFRHEHEDGKSDRLDWPGGASGVTIGAGYDMGGKSAAQITRDLTEVGVPRDQTAVAAASAGLKAGAARDYVASHRNEFHLTASQEKALLTKELKASAALVDGQVKVPLTQAQHDALVSFAFNIGDAGFKGSTTLRKLNAGDYDGAAQAMKLWNKSDGRVMQGLVNRRADEVAYFNSKSGPATATPTAPAETKKAAPAGKTGGVEAPSGSGADQAEAYAQMVLDHGDARAKADLAAGRTVLVGLRTPTRLDANGGNGTYDDRMVMVRKAGDHYEARTFKSNTEPSTQYLSARNIARGVTPPDVNGDGRGDLGELVSGQTVHYTRGTFLNAKALKADGDQTVGIRRDTNGDNRLDGKDPVIKAAGAAGMHIHRGGADNTWSMGCQTLGGAEHTRFFNALDSQAANQQHFSYVLLDAR